MTHAGQGELTVLGRTRLVDGTGEVPLRPRERTVLAALALRHPGPTDVDELVEAVWPREVPPTARKSVHNHVLRVRRAAGGVIRTVAGGYELDDGLALDAARFEDLVHQASTAAARRAHAEAAEGFEA